MKLFLNILILATSITIAGEPTLSSGYAISLHVRKMMVWVETDSTTSLVKSISNNYEDRYDIFNMNSESADFQVVNVWPEGANFKVHASFVWPFTCDLIGNFGLARQLKVAGPCGAGWQLDTVSTTLKIGSLNVWMPLRTNNISDSVAERKNRMSSSSAWIHITIEGADSAEVLIANWKTDKVILAAPTSLELPDFLTLKNDRGSALKVVETDTPVAIISKKPMSSSFRGNGAIWNSSTSTWEFLWTEKAFDLKGRK